MNEREAPLVSMQRSCWRNEDGDHWTIIGHFTDAVARERVLECERYWAAPAGLDDELAALIAEATVERGWVIDCEWNEEAMHRVAEGTPGAYPVTWVSA